MGDVTKILQRVSGGDRAAIDELIPLVYAELRGLARQKLRAEREGHTLTPTALVHEAFLRLVDQRRVEWRDRAHFFSFAAHAMRRILVSYARRRLAKKRQAGEAMVTFGDGESPRTVSPEELIMLDLALEKLGNADHRRATVVELYFFGGMSQQEVADVLGVSSMTVHRDWVFAQAWLSKELRPA